MQAGVLRSSELTFSTTRPPDRPGVETLLPKLGVRVGSEGTHLLEAYPTVPLAAVGGSLELHRAPSRLREIKGTRPRAPPCPLSFHIPVFALRTIPRTCSYLLICHPTHTPVFQKQQIQINLQSQSWPRKFYLKFDFLFRSFLNNYDFRGVE